MLEILFLEILLLNPMGFGLSYFHFHLPLGNFFLFPLWFIQWSIGCLVAYCLASKCLYFLSTIFFLELIYHLIALWSEKMLDMTWFLKIEWGLFCGLTYNLSWRIVYVHLKRMCILLLLECLLSLSLSPPALSTLSPIYMYKFSLMYI